MLPWQFYSYLATEGLEKTFIDYSDDTFPKEMGVINLLYMRNLIYA